MVRFLFIIPPCLLAAIWLGLSLGLRHNSNNLVPRDSEAKLELLWSELYRRMSKQELSAISWQRPLTNFKSDTFCAKLIEN